MHYVKEGRKRGPSGFGAVSGKIVSVEKWPIRDKKHSKMGGSRNGPEMTQKWPIRGVVAGGLGRSKIVIFRFS